MRVGWLGLGRMGRPMARRLLSAGFGLSVWNRSPEPAAELAAAGAQVAATPAALAAGADVAVSCVTAPADLQAVVAAALPGVVPGLLWIDHSTIDPASARRAAAQLAQRGAAFLDAPVSGGIQGAAAGTLTIMSGGSAADFERARPVLAAYGKNLHRLGETGAGAAAKLINQFLTAVHTTAAAQAFLLGKRAGLDLAALYQVLGTSFGESRMLHRSAPNTLSGDHSQGGIPIHLIMKDLGMIGDWARELRVPVSLGQAAEAAGAVARALGLGDLDMSGLIVALERLAPPPDQP